jgi:DtxR family Mn-dependent transcriptional regulator
MRRYDCCEITHSEVVEDYLKTVFALETRGEPTGTSALAEKLDVAAPTVSAMLKRLAAAGLVSRPDLHTVELTDHGRRHAVGIVRRHRLIETFLADVLAVPWDQVHDEAEVLEHGVSDRLLERIDALLGHPARDPHGDPIPPASGGHDEHWTASLAAAEPGCRFRVERVSDRDSDALRHLGRMGIRPGVVVEVDHRDPFGGPLWVRVGDGSCQGLGPALADLVHGRAT